MYLIYLLSQLFHHDGSLYIFTYLCAEIEVILMVPNTVKW